MHILGSRGFWVSVFCSVALILVGCGGGSSSSSGSGGVTLNSSMMVKGNVSNVSGGTARVDFDTGQYPIVLAERFARRLISAAQAQVAPTPLGGIEVCVEAICTTTAGDGSFTLNVESLPGGTYTIRFTYDGVAYEAPINLKNYSITELQGVVLMEDSGQIRITNIRVTTLQPAADDEEEPTAKVAVCHKPGTPAEQTLVVSESALSAHLGHGDYEGACDTNASPVSATE